MSQRADGHGVQSPDFFEDAGGDFVLFVVGTEDHFQAGIEIVDVVEGEGFGGFGLDGGSVLELSVMGGDEVQEMQANVFGGWLQGFPLIGHDFTPKGVDEFDADADVAEELAAEFPRDVEALLGRAHFPQLAAVVEERAGQEQVAVQAWIHDGNRVRSFHHLRGVAQQTSAEGMVIAPGSGGSAETRREIFQIRRGEGLKARVFDARDERRDEGEVFFVGRAGCFIAGEEVGGFFLLQKTQLPTGGIDAISAEGKFAFDLDGLAAAKLLAEREIGRIAPRLQREGVPGIAELDLEVGFAVAVFLTNDVVDLGMDTGRGGTVTQGFAQGANSQEIGHEVGLSS